MGCPIYKLERFKDGIEHIYAFFFAFVCFVRLFFLNEAPKALTISTTLSFVTIISIKNKLFEFFRRLLFHQSISCEIV